MRIKRQHAQNGGGILTPNVRFPERRCGCRICSRPNLLARGLAALNVKRRRTHTVGLAARGLALLDSLTESTTQG